MITILNTYNFIGLFLILFSLVMTIFPPSFGNQFYGVCTQLTLKNKTIWAFSQKLYSYAHFILGIIFIVFGIVIIYFKLQFPAPLPFFLFIFLYQILKQIVNKILKSKHLI